MNRKAIYASIEDAREGKVAPSVQVRRIKTRSAPIEREVSPASEEVVAEAKASLTRLLKSLNAAP